MSEERKNKTMLERLMQWTSERPGRRSFLVRSRYGAPNVWIEISEHTSKFELDLPMDDPSRILTEIEKRIARFAEIAAQPINGDH